MKLLASIAALCACQAMAFGQPGPDPAAALWKQIEANPRSSRGHYLLGQLFFEQRNYQSAANEFREALTGDLQPQWTTVWSHVNLGRIFDLTGQHERATNEYRLAGLTNDNTWGALDEAARYLTREGRLDDPQLPSNAYRSNNLVLGPEPIEKTEPEYSEEAKAAGLEGTVFLTGAIGPDGFTNGWRVTGPLGLGLDEQALEAVKRWRFAPAGARPASLSIAIDFLLPLKQSRWHLIGADFRAPEGATRPVFLTANYPLGAGIGPKALDEGWVLSAIRRQARATLSFDIDEQGVPSKFVVLSASEALWGDEAINVVRFWRFKPGNKDGVPISVPCTLQLIWGQKVLSAWSLAQLRELMDPRQAAAGVFEARAPQGPSPDPASWQVISTVDPSYTDAARQAKLEGMVRLSVVVGEDGVPRDVGVMNSLGLGLDEKAIEAVRQWRFRPPLVNGRPISAPVVVEVRFHLPQSNAAAAR